MGVPRGPGGPHPPWPQRRPLARSLLTPSLTRPLPRVYLEGARNPEAPGAAAARTCVLWAPGPCSSASCSDRTPCRPRAVQRAEPGGLPSALTCTQTFCTSQESWLWSDICRHPVPGLLPPPWPPMQPQLSQHPARLGPRVGPTCGAPAGPRGRTGRPRAGPAAALPPSHTEGTGSHCLGWPAASAAPRARGDTGWKGREKRR